MRRLLLLATKALLFLVLGTVLLWTAWSVRASHRLQAARDALRAAGLPTRFGELHAQDVPAGENAARLYVEASALAGAIPSFDFGAYPEVTSEMREAVSAAADALAILRQAADIPRATYITRSPEGGDWQIPSLREFPMLARLLLIRAHLSLQQNDSSGAAEDLRAIFRLAGSMRQGPTILFHVVRMTIAGIGLEGLKSLLPRCEHAAAVLERIGPDTIRGAVACGLVGEAVQCMEFFLGEHRGAAVSGPAGNLLSWLTSERGPARPHWKEGAAVYLEALKDFIEAAEKPYPQALAEWSRIDASLSQQGGFVLPIIVVQMSPLLRKEAQLEARLRLAELAALCIDHRWKAGSFPEALEDLGRKDLPEDPLGGKPFKLQRSEGKLCIESQEDSSVSWTLQ